MNRLFLFLSLFLAGVASHGQATVSWTLDLNGLEPSSDGVYLVGGFNNWTIGVDSLVQSEENPNYWHITKDLPAGLNLYKFVNGLTWEGVEVVDAACASDDGYGNRWVEVQENSDPFELSFCWGSCASCQLTSILFRVDMGETPIDPAGVHVAGDFQGWEGNTTPMADANGDGIWEALYSFDASFLGLGNETHFKFLNGDSWDTAEWIEGECGDGNGNRSLLLDSGPDIVVGVGAQSADESAVPCFGSCEACSPATVTFRADVSGLDPDSVGAITIGGPWNGWNQSETPLEPTGENGIWEVTLELTRNTTYSFKFANDGQYEFHGIDFECDIFDGTFYHNRFVTTGGVGSNVVYNGCYDSCAGASESHLNCMGDCLMDSDGDGICDPFDWAECTDEAACNFGELVFGDDPCVYPMIPGDCDAGSSACGVGTMWDPLTQKCVIDESQVDCFSLPIDNSCYFDVSGNGVVGPEDLLSFLASFASTCEADVVNIPWMCGDPLEYQGYDYATVLIGEQCWFAENLRAENYSNGDTVISQSDESSWVTTVIGSTGVYGDGVVPCAHSCGQPEVSLFEFGRLYNWWAVTDERNVCATGWHVPSNDEWLEMEGFVQALVGDSVSFALKSSSGWLPVGDQVGNGTNQFGMNILASGNRDVNQQEMTAMDANVGSQASIWTTSSHNSEFGLFRYYHHLIPEPSVGLGVFQSGLYVRCIKD